MRTQHDAQDGQEMTEGMARLSQEVERLIDHIFHALDPLCRRIEDLWTGRRDRSTIHPGELNILMPEIHRLLREHEDFVGTGFVADPEILEHHDRYQEWWQQREGQSPTFLSAEVTATASEEIYDYVVMPWFKTAKAGNRATYGPYMDVEGSSEYVVTFAAPVNVNGVFLGVVGADVSLQLFEQCLVNALSTWHLSAVLLTDDDRVIASSSYDFAPGERARLQRLGGVLGGRGVRWQLAKVPA